MKKAVYSIRFNREKEFKKRKAESKMKKNFMKLLSVVLALAAVFSLAVPSLAADVNADKAKQIALKDAGYSAKQVEYIRAEYDVDDGVKVWNVDILAKDSKGRLVDYDYEISAKSGRILEKDREYEKADAGDKAESLLEGVLLKLVKWLISLFS